jgi:cytochrome P450
LSDQLPPGPRAPASIQSIGWWTRPIAFLERCRARYGKRFTVRLLGTPKFAMLSDPEELRQVFTAPPEVLHPGRGAKILETILGSNSVITLDEGAHLEQRKLMLPAFHGERMEALTGLLEEVTEQEVAGWPAGEPIELHPRLQQLTLEVILRAVFGIDPGRRLDDLRASLTEILGFADRPFTLLPPPIGALAQVGPWKRLERVKARTDELLFALIDDRRGTEGDDVLSMLLAARHEDGSPMSDAELRDELMTLLVAGHETTASELAWAFERLSREPRVLSRLREEVASGDGDAYLTATIQETLRRRPVLPNSAPRLVVEPVEIGGWRYPAGVCVVPNAYLVHHDPEIYEDPYAFRPERFLDSPPGTYTWIPFGGGRRRCLGASFAMLEMRVVLGAVLRRGGIEPGGTEHETARRRSITISPARGARTRLERPAPAVAGVDVVPEADSVLL